MFKVELKDDVANTALAGLQEHLSDVSDVMNKISDFMLHSTQERFKVTEAPDGSQWAPRSPVTLARYKKEGGKIGTILHRTGDLVAWIFGRSDATSVTIASNAVQAAVMQLGAVKGSLGPRSPWGDIPARPFIGMSDSDRVGILASVDEWLARITQP